MVNETGWYRGDQKPIRIGAYKRKYPNGSICYSWWDGRLFHWAVQSLRITATGLDVSRHQSLPWRGLASRSGK